MNGAARSMMTVNHSLLPSIGNANLPAKYEAAKIALAECDRIDECKEWADKSKALASYAKQSKNKVLEHTAMRIRARAIRRCGELLKEVTTERGRRVDLELGGGASPKSSQRECAAKQATLSNDQSKAAMRVANIKQDSFEQQVESDQPPSITKLAAQGKTAPSGVPIYEKLGMTKEAFQAGMYFRGDIEAYLKAMKRHDPQDVANGSTKEQRKTIRRNLELIEQYHDTLKAKL